MMPATTFRFQRGVFQTFVASRLFTVENRQIPKGATILFDGSMMEYAGNQYPAPTLHGAFHAGWLVRPEDYTGDTAARPSANIQVRHPTNGNNPMIPGSPAKTAMVAISNEEQEVGTLAGHRAMHQQRGASRGRTLVTGAVEPQDGVPVRTLQTPSGEVAKTTRTVLTAASAGEAIRQANQAGVIEPGKGISEEEFLARITPEEREEYLAKKGARLSVYAAQGFIPDTTAPAGRSAPVAAPVDLRPAVQKMQAEGITFTVTGGGVQPEASAKPAVVVKMAGEDVRRRVAKSICADFPDLYDFAQPLKKKVARLHADFDDRPDVIRAVFAAEGDEVKAALLDEFPEVFAG